MDCIEWTWLIVVAACVLIEAFTLGLTTIWFAIGALAAWLVSMAGLSVYVQIVAFMLVSISCLILTRPIAVKKLKIGKEKTNLDSLIGETAKVESTIDNFNDKGYAKVRGQIWSARAVDDDIIEKNELVIIKEIKGVKLIVKRK
jgi:membrane protein implicated in regulation of membrane protease activity